MTKGILGRKIGMTQVFGENGELIPVTVVEASLNLINMLINQLKVMLKKLTQHLSASFVNSATLTLTNTK